MLSVGVVFCAWIGGTFSLAVSADGTVPVLFGGPTFVNRLVYQTICFLQVSGNFLELIGGQVLARTCLALEVCCHMLSSGSSIAENLTLTPNVLFSYQ